MSLKKFDCHHFILFDEYIKHDGSNFEKIIGEFRFILDKINNDLNDEEKQKYDYLQKIIKLFDDSLEILKKFNTDNFLSQDVHEVIKDMKFIITYMNRINSHKLLYNTKKFDITYQKPFYIIDFDSKDSQMLEQDPPIIIKKIIDFYDDKEIQQTNADIVIYKFKGISFFDLCYKYLIHIAKDIKMEDFNKSETNFIIPFGYINRERGHAVNILVDYQKNKIIYANSGEGIDKNIQNPDGTYNSIVINDLDKNNLLPLYIKCCLYNNFTDGNINGTYDILNEFFLKENNQQYISVTPQISGTCTYHTNFYLIKYYLLIRKKNFTEFETTLKVKTMELFLDKFTEHNNDNKISENMRNYLYILDDKIISIKKNVEKSLYENKKFKLKNK